MLDMIETCNNVTINLRCVDCRIICILDPASLDLKIKGRPTLIPSWKQQHKKPYENWFLSEEKESFAEISIALSLNWASVMR
jgi:hypothetical protein